MVFKKYQNMTKMTSHFASSVQFFPRNVHLKSILTHSVPPPSGFSDLPTALQCQPDYACLFLSESGNDLPFLFKDLGTKTFGP